MCCFANRVRYNVKVDIDNHLRYTDEEYQQHLTVSKPVAIAQQHPQCTTTHSWLLEVLEEDVIERG